jgi:hypothetical protein
VRPSSCQSSTTSVRPIRRSRCGVRLRPPAETSSARSGVSEGLASRSLNLAIETAPAMRARARSGVHPSSFASAASHPSGTPWGGGGAIKTDAAPALRHRLPASIAYLAPGSSASGQTTTRRPLRGDQSAFAALLLPFGLVTATKPGRSAVQASAALPPSAHYRDGVRRLGESL